MSQSRGAPLLPPAHGGGPTNPVDRRQTTVGGGALDHARDEGVRLGVVGRPRAHRWGCSTASGVGRSGSLVRGRRSGCELRRRGRGGVPRSRGARDGEDETRRGGGPWWPGDGE
jgi:hypothetical protein